MYPGVGFPVPIDVERVHNRQQVRLQRPPVRPAQFACQHQVAQQLVEAAHRRHTHITTGQLHVSHDAWQAFLERYRGEYGQPRKRLHASAVQTMMRYHWPGNVRELENTIHRVILMTEDDVIGADDLNLVNQGGTWSAGVPRDAMSLGPFRMAKEQAIAQFERDYLCDLLACAQGNVSLAARMAGKERRTLGRLLKKHGLDPHQFM